MHNEWHYDHILVYIIQGSSFHLAVTTALMLCMIWSVLRVLGFPMMGANADPQFNEVVTLQSQNRPTLQPHFEPDPPNFSSLRPMSLLPSCHVLSWLSHDLPIVSALFQKTYEKRFRLRDMIVNITNERIETYKTQNTPNSRVICQLLYSACEVELRMQCEAEGRSFSPR